MSTWTVPGDHPTLAAALDAVSGANTATLAEETVVVVVSEMGRTPYESGNGGKDHWPFTSLMLMGPGIAGNQVLGGYDEYLNGMGMDPATGATTGGDVVSITPDHIGATLLTLADVDYEQRLPGIPPVLPFLA